MTKRVGSKSRTLASALKPKTRNESSSASTASTKPALANWAVPAWDYRSSSTWPSHSAAASASPVSRARAARFQSRCRWHSVCAPSPAAQQSGDHGRQQQRIWLRYHAGRVEVVERQADSHRLSPREVNLDPGDSGRESTEGEHPRLTIERRNGRGKRAQRRYLRGQQVIERIVCGHCVLFRVAGTARKLRGAIDVPNLATRPCNGERARIVDDEFAEIRPAYGRAKKELTELGAKSRVCRIGATRAGKPAIRRLAQIHPGMFENGVRIDDAVAVRIEPKADLQSRKVVRRRERKHLVIGRRQTKRCCFEIDECCAGMRTTELET